MCCAAECLCFSSVQAKDHILEVLCYYNDGSSSNMLLGLVSLSKVSLGDTPLGQPSGFVVNTSLDVIGLQDTKDRGFII